MENEILEATQHAIDLAIIDNDKFITSCIVKYLKSIGIKCEPTKEGMLKVKQIFDKLGYELKVICTNLELEEKEAGHIKASQIIRIKLVPKLEV